jgi:hypothetical protein
MSARTQSAIMSRIIEPDKAELPASVARVFLGWRFSADDRERMQELLKKAKAGKLTRSEKDEAENYERVGHLLSILKLKARASLKVRNGDS